MFSPLIQAVLLRTTFALTRFSMGMEVAPQGSSSLMSYSSFEYYDSWPDMLSHFLFSALLFSVFFLHRLNSDEPKADVTF